MPWSYDPSAWTTATKPGVSDFKHIATDLHTLGANKDSARYGLANAAFATLVPQELPGTQYTVTAGSWTTGTVTLTIGAHNIKVNQLIIVASVVPSDYNNGGIEVAVTGVSGTQVSYALAANPGAWTSGGTVTAWGTPVAGMIASDATGTLKEYSGSAWVAVGSGGSSPTWNAPTLLNSWANQGGGNTNAGYTKDVSGFVWVRGSISGGTTTDGTVLFNLPAGYRPPNPLSIPCVNANTNTAFRLNIDSGGNVSIYNLGASGIPQMAFSFASF